MNFRVLIIGRANAGKTSILQRVCDTTESPVVYRQMGNRREVVRACGLTPCPSRLTPPQVQLHPSMDVGDTLTSLWSFLILQVELAWRAQYRRRTCVLQS